MKRSEYLASEYSKRHTKAWDYFSVSCGTYLTAYKQAKTDILSAINGWGVQEHVLKCIGTVGDEQVSQDVTDGEHQLSIAAFAKWQNVPFKDTLTTFLAKYNVTDLRVTEKDGVVSFQGTFTK